MLDWIKARLKEPSTYGAIAALLIAVGVNVDETTLGTIGAGVAAVIGIILGEKK